MVRAMLADMSSGVLEPSRLDLNPVDTFQRRARKSMGLSRNYDLDHRALLVRFEFSTLVADGQSLSSRFRSWYRPRVRSWCSRGGDEPMSCIPWNGPRLSTRRQPTRPDERFGRYVVEA